MNHCPASSFPLRAAALCGLLLSALLGGCGREQAAAQVTPAPAAESAPPAAAAAQTGDPLALAVEAIDEADYRRHIEVLASDAFGGRAPGTPGEDLTVDYLVKHFAGLGLAPANGDSYTQEVPLASVELTNQPALLIRGGASEDLSLTYAVDQVMWTQRQVPQTALAD